MNRRFLCASAQIAMMAYMLAACTTPGTHPPVADIRAVIEAKPKPGTDILTDPAANDRYNSAVEGWGDRIHSAGLRLCRYFEETGVRVSCDS